MYLIYILISQDILVHYRGETFQASLALALGLSEVVQQESGGITLESMFIDEGFGTLDQETLETSLDTLLNLKHLDGW